MGYRMGFTEYFAVASLVVSIGIGVLMAIFPKWRIGGWAILCICVGVLAGSTVEFSLADSSLSRASATVSLAILSGFCVLFAVGCLAFWIERPRAKVADHAQLRLQCFGDGRIPTAVRTVNVAFWLAYFTPHARISFSGQNGEVLQQHEIPKNWAIFVAFDQPTSFREIIVGFNAPGLPMYDVMHPNSRGVMVAFRGDIPAGELEISTKN